MAVVRAAAVFVALASIGCTAGERRAAPSPPAPTETVDTYVIDERGPVKGMFVKVVSLPDGRCPCATPFDTTGYDNVMPSCACPEALASWHARLASCERESHVVDTVVTDEQGKATLARRPGVTAIEVSPDRGVRWLSWPVKPAQSMVTLELAPSIRPFVRITGAHDDTGENGAGIPAANVRGAVLFEDGHCIPLERRDEAWVPRHAFPRFEQNGGTLVVEAPGYATIVQALLDENTIDLVLHRDVPITGTCNGPIARLDNPFQHLMTKVDKTGQFSFTGALDLESTVSCWIDAENEIDEWRYTHENGIEPNDVNIYGGGFGECDNVKIVDDAGHPIAGAQVATFQDIDDNMSEGLGNARTNGAGIACVDGIGYGARLVVHAPAADGGQCAGSVETKLTREQTTGSPLVVRLRATALPARRARGRILGPEGLPVAHAWVDVSEIAPAATPDCTSAVANDDVVITAADGTFALPPYPRGTLTISVQHDWYDSADVQLANDGKPHDIVVKRKAATSKAATSRSAK